MKRANSLKGKKIFKEIFQKGRKQRGPVITAFVLKDKSETTGGNQSERRQVKIGISAGRQLGKAYQRNLIKRRIKVICRDLIDNMGNGFLIIIKPGSGSVDLSFEELKFEIITILKNSGVINGSG